LDEDWNLYDGILGLCEKKNGFWTCWNFFDLDLEILGGFEG
jgi:hypothetical protein